VPESDATSWILPIHIEETIQSIAGLHAEHHANATHHQRVVDRITSLLGRASFIAALTAFVVGWVSMNCFVVALGYRALDPPPFAWFAGASSLASLYLVILILTTQRGDDRLTQRRELLNLELTILSEQKIAKVVALLEELRHTVANCARPACTRKNWAKPVGATASATGNFALVARAASIIIGMCMKSNESWCRSDPA
jgi:uncharacterized membrane protein